MLLFFMLGRFVNGIKRFPENEKPVVQVFQHQIARHIQNRDKYIVPSAALRRNVNRLFNVKFQRTDRTSAIRYFGQ